MTDDEVLLAQTAARAGVTCLVGVTLTLVALRFLLHFSWWWCALPLGIAVTCSALYLLVSVLLGRKNRPRHR